MGMQIAAEIEHYKFEPEDTSIPEFIVLEFTGHEGISQLTHFDIKLLNTDPEIDFSKLLNKRASLRIWCWQDDDYSRVYHGIVSSFRQIGQYTHGQQEYALFQADLVPLLWRGTLSYSCRIFQEMNVPDIIEYILADVGFQGDDYDISSLQGTYDPLTDPPREFCVQYRETNFHFLSRLMEEEGIFYFFEYGDDKEKLIIADANSVFEETAPASEVRYEVPTEMQPLEEEYVHPLSYAQNVISAAFGLKDFNYDTPSTDLHASSHIDQTDHYEVYDHPGHFGFLDRGSDLARIRNEESEAGRKLISGGSNCRSFCAGYKFTLLDPPRSDLEGEYLLTSVSHHGIQPGVMATDSKISYDNKFECIPSDVPYRPPRVTPKARVQGTQTATVTGPPGQDLYMDDKGRAKIKFHWDLEDATDETTSCWVRVSHGYAGGDHGIQFHPIVGDEVVVDFLEGDPDKPIIVGRVYNAEKMPPLKPEDAIENIILTPYQHRLLMDDKASQIVLNTGGGETLTMTDGGENSDYGNNINASTADGHFIHLAKGQSADGITIQTVNENLIVLDDMNRNITIKTTDGHTAVLDDQNKNISIISTEGHSIVIDDQAGKITTTDSSGVHQFQIDINGGKITISTNTGSIDMKAPAGSITLEALDIKLNASANIAMSAGMQIGADAFVISMKGDLFSSEGSMLHATKGTMVQSEATGPHIIRGNPVMIN